MPRISPTTIALVLGLLASTAMAQLTEAEQAFNAAHYMEMGLRNYKEAFERYQQASELAGNTRNVKLLLKCLLGRGRCAHALGKREAAKHAFERALQLDPKSAEAKQGLQQRPPPQDPELSTDIRRLIAKLTGSERDQAANDLAVIGSRALPYLEEGLRDTAVAVVTGCARALARLRSDEATKALIKALQQGNLALPEAIVDALKNRRMRDADHLAIIKAAMKHPSERVRRLAPQMVWTYRNRFKGELTWPEWEPVLNALLDSPLGSVRIELLRQARNWPPQAYPRILERAALDLTAADPHHQLAACSAVTQITYKFRVEGSEEMAQPYQARTAEVLASLIQHSERSISPSACNMLRDMPRPHAESARRAIMDAIRSVVTRRDLAMTRLPLADLVSDRDNQPLLPPEDLAELFVVAAPSDDAPSLVRGPVSSFRQHVARSLFNGGDSEERRRLALETWKRIGDDEGRATWIEYLHGKRIRVAPLYAEAARSPDRRVRQSAYVALRGTAEKLTAPLQLPHLPGDMLDERGRMAELARSMARRFPSALWIPPLEKALLQENDRGPLENLIRTIAAQEKQHSLLILRRVVRKDNRDRIRLSALTELIKLDRDRAVPDMLAMLPEKLRVSEVMKAYADARRAWDGEGPLLSAQARLAIARGVPMDKRDFAYVNEVLPLLPVEQRRPFLDEALKSMNASVRRAAVLACARVSLADYARKILDLTQDSNQGVREVAVKALEQYRFSLEMKRLIVDGGDLKAMQTALERSRSKDATQRVGAAYALGALGGSQAVTRLMEMQDDQEKSVREAALSALERLGGKPKK